MRSFVFVLLCLLTACKAPRAPGPATDTGGLSEKEFTRLAAINQTQESALRTVGRGTCALSRSGNKPARAGGSWISRRATEASAECPVRFQEQWAYDPGRKTLNYFQNFQVDNAEIARKGGFSGRRASGMIKREGPPGRERNVGAIHFDRMQINNIGRVEADVTVNHASGPKGRGDIEIHLRDGGRSFVGRVTWNSASKPLYFVNDRPITEDGFRRLFSSYGASEIMANLDKLR